MWEGKEKKERKPKEFMDVQTEDVGGNLMAFLTITTFPMQAEAWLMKWQKLPPVW